MNPIESIPSKQPHFTMEQYDLILNNHEAVGRATRSTIGSTGLEPQKLTWQAETLPLGHQLHVFLEPKNSGSILVEDNI